MLTEEKWDEILRLAAAAGHDVIATCEAGGLDIYKCECGWESEVYYDDARQARASYLSHLHDLHTKGDLNIDIPEDVLHKTAFQQAFEEARSQMTVAASAKELWKERQARKNAG